MHLTKFAVASLLSIETYASNPPSNPTPNKIPPAAEVIILVRPGTPIALQASRLLYRDEDGKLQLLADLLLETEDEDFDFCYTEDEDGDDDESFFDIAEDAAINVPRGTSPSKPVESKSKVGH